ncbi:DUF885 domain-containing protein [Fodinicola feengrottensis]|uniref:DUF885 domain-containing protein n=1 Tax=Fodinicola feengrottensis TaxID=435914 RepID=A0ABN2I7W3_9ACTN
METNRVVRELADWAWARVLERDPATAARTGQQVETLPRGGAGQLEADVGDAQWALEKLGTLDTADLSADDQLTAGFLADHFRQEVAEASRFWFRFPVTPYNASMLSTYRSDIFGTAALDTASDADRYLSLLDDYAAVVDQLLVTLQGQSHRGIALPAWSIDAVTNTIRAHADASGDLAPGQERLGRLAYGPAGRLTDRVRQLIEGPISGAYERLLAYLAAETGSEGVGIGQFPGGAECYADLLYGHTGLAVTPDHVHELGLSEVDRLTDRIHSALGITDEVAYRQRLQSDPRLYATDPADLERRFQAHIDRLGDRLSGWFREIPAAPFRLRRLDVALEAGSTFGYYEPPGVDECGYYHYNGSDLAHRPLLQSASMIYHEGMPGHHLQIGRQLESTALHPIRREASELRTFALSGYFEGWAEYAAGLGVEMGLYEDPFDLYGRLCSERFHAARMVVDTGLAVRGWTLARAGDFLRTNGFLSATEIRTELVRYAVDDPGQAVAYHLGHRFLADLRGTRDPRDFHETVLSGGPLPLSLLASLTNAD